MPIIELEVFAGENITRAIEKAIELANSKQVAVSFKFNDTSVLVQPGDLAANVEDRWRSDMEAAQKAYFESEEYRVRKSQDELEQALKEEASMKEAAATEAAMRDATAPWPQTKAQLIEYIDSLVDREHDYGTCVYAMSLAAVATFHYVAHTLGTTGFQSSCADLDIIRRTRLLKGPFMLIKAEDGLYPQYDLREKLEEALESWKPWFKEEATKKLADVDPANAASRVSKHWKKLASLELPEKPLDTV